MNCKPVKRVSSNYNTNDNNINLSIHMDKIQSSNSNNGIISTTNSINNIKLKQYDDEKINWNRVGLRYQ